LNTRKSLGLGLTDLPIKNKERKNKMIEPPIEPPESYWGYEEEEDYSLELSKIQTEKEME
jgi:hypothetical protein